MHELSITHNLLDIVCDHAGRAGATKVTGVHLVIGDLSSIVDDSVQFYWNIISEETVAEEATLHFRRVPFQLECRECNILFEPTGESFTCVGCGSKRVRVGGGDDLRVEAIDVEDAPGDLQMPKEHDP